MSDGKINPIRETDSKACKLGRKLIDDARFASIAVLEPDSGMPIVSRIGVATDNTGNLVFLASEISNHTKALALDPRASIMVGEPGKGDPLAHPRITLIGTIEKIYRSSKERDLLRDPYLSRHPKAELYIDFSDFHFFRLILERGNLNGGFGQAYELTSADLARKT
jgi:putative heme iron utilization protein